MECTACGACCVAPDIAALDKPLGARCPQLGEDCLCTTYEARPDTCRRYQPDELCERIAAPTLDERVERYLDIFGLTEEAARVRAVGVTSMREARRLPVATSMREARRLPVATSMREARRLPVVTSMREARRLPVVR